MGLGRPRSHLQAGVSFVADIILINPTSCPVQEEAWDLADRVVIFNRGRVEQEGTPADITEHPNSPFVMDFTGETQHLPSTCQVGCTASR